MIRTEAYNSECISRLLDEILTDADKLIGALPKDGNKFDVLSISMFVTMIDIVTDINHLVKINRYLSIPSLVRNFMDTYVDLLLVTSNSENVYPLLYKVYSDELKVLKAKINPLHSSFFKDNNDLEAIEKQITEKENDLIELRKLVGSNKLKTIRVKYERVKLLWFYETIYSDLCSQTHNGLNSIERRHIFPKTEDKILIKYLQSFDTQDYFKYILTLLIHFHVSIESINKSLNLKCDSLIEEVEHKIHRFINLK